MFLLDFLNAIGYFMVMIYGIYAIFKERQFNSVVNRRAVVQIPLVPDFGVSLKEWVLVFITIASALILYPESMRAYQYLDGTLELNQRFTLVEMMYTVYDFLNIFAHSLIIYLFLEGCNVE